MFACPYTKHSKQLALNSPPPVSMCCMPPCRWADLPTIDAKTAANAKKLRSPLTGDPAFQYKIGEPEAEDAAAADTGEGEAGAKAVVTETARLRAMIDSINSLTDVIPKVGNRAAWDGGKSLQSCGRS